MKKVIEIIKKKWLRSVALTILLIAIIICAYLVANLGIKKLNITDLDMTKEKIYSISQQTEDKLGKLNEDVTIYVFNMQEYIMDFVNRYAKVNDHIKIEKLENLNAHTTWKTVYGVTDTSSFIVTSCGEREKLLNNYDLVTYDYSTYEEIDITEEAITNAILDVTIENKPKIYFLTGHNLYEDGYFYALQQNLTDEANEIKSLDLLKTSKVPEDCNVLVMTALKEDITEAERDAILEYIKKGGDILLLSDPNLDKIKLSNFKKVLDEYGVSISEGIMLEGDADKMISGAPNFTISTINAGSSIIQNISMEMNVCLMNPGKLNFVSAEELEEKQVTVENLAYSSDKAFYRTELTSSSQSKIASDEDAGGAVLGAMLTKKINDDTSSKMIVFANTLFATNTQIQVSSQHYMYAMDFYNNEDVLLNSISYLTQREDTITIRKNIEAITYTVNEQQNRIILAIIFAVPIFIILLGIVIWILRRRKK